MDAYDRIVDELVTVDDLDLEGQRVLLRADLDVPLTSPSEGAPAQVGNDARIRAALTTIDELRRRGARLVLAGHLGAPGHPAAGLSMGPVANRLAELTGAAVPLAPAVTGTEVRGLADRLQPGEMLMLENLSREAGEQRDDPALAAALAELADIYVDDAFSIAARSLASTRGVATLLPSAAGRVMERHLRALSAVVDEPAQPLVVILGGTKLAEKIGLLQRLLNLADVVCLAGSLCFPFLAALGHDVGKSICPHDDVELARRILLEADGATRRLALPRDFVLARWAEGRRPVLRYLEGADVPGGWMALDIGPLTARQFAERLSAAATVFWTGPVGRFELGAFAAGTRQVAEAIAATPAMTVVGGDETVNALAQFGLEDRVSHILPGGEAMLGILEKRELPGIRVLRRSPSAARAA